MILDEVREGVNHVGIIDGKIDNGVGVQIGEGNPKGEGLVVGFGGGGDFDDVLELVRLNVLDDLVSGDFLQIGKTSPNPTPSTKP